MIVVTLHPAPSAQLLKSLVRHDLSESVFGDIPSQAKKDFPEIREMEKRLEKEWWKDQGIDLFEGLTEADRLWIEFADAYEVVLFLSHRPFITQELQEIRMKCGENAKDCIEMLMAHGFFLDADESSIN